MIGMAMNLVSTQSDGAVILYDADMLGKIDAAFFEPESWSTRGALLGSARGRGATWFVRHDGRELVLRHYRRGGMLGPWLGDRYLWLGLARTRAFRELHLLAELHRRALPVPRPLAARVHRAGLCYRADLVTERIADAASLAQSLTRTALSPQRWRAIGHCLREFHGAGAYHADLNAHNVMLTQARIYLLDFDRGCLRAPGAWARANLARLRRSLDKLARENPALHFTDRDWHELLAGYTEPPSSGQSSASATR